jgi:hypothetical protein
MLTFLNAAKSKSSPFSARDTPSVLESQSDNSSLLLGYQQQERSQDWSAVSLDKDLVDELDQELDDDERFHENHDETTPKKFHNSPEHSKDLSVATIPDAGYITLEEHDLDHLDFDDDEEQDTQSRVEFNNTTAEIQKLEDLLGEELKDDSVFMGRTSLQHQTVSEAGTALPVVTQDPNLDCDDTHQELTSYHNIQLRNEPEKDQITPQKSVRKELNSVVQNLKAASTNGAPVYMETHMMDQVMQEVEYLRDLNEKLVRVNEEYREALGKTIAF